MTYGLRIINDDSELLVDSEYFSPAFVQKLEFNTTTTATEAATGQLHPGYVRRTYTTPSITAAGNYIVMWTVPDNGSNDVWYSFETSTTTIMGSLTCYVYANSTGSALTYTLPTAYLFTTDTLPATTGPALRMYNSSSVKTFDSNNLQLAPYSISDAFAFSIAGANPDVYGATPVSISLSMPTNPIFMIPDYSALRIKQGSGFARHDEYVYESAFKRVGTSLSTRLFIKYYALEDYFWPSATTTYTTGKNSDLSVIVADANLYEAASGGTGTGTNPTYTLSSNFSSRDEGTSVTVTLTTTYVADGTKIYYTVTGVAAADLSAGGVTGYFSITNNTATATFTFANDLVTEGTETFVLSLDGLPQSVSVTVNDTSKTPATYSWSTPNNVTEGSQGYTVFNATNANGKVVTFSVVAPTTGVTISASDGTLNTTSWTVSGDAATSVNVYYTANQDYSIEGPVGFRINATVDGVTYTSGNITINDGPGYGISAANSWTESSTTNTVTISSSGVAVNTVIYLTTSNSLVTPAVSSVTVNATSFSTNVNYTAGIVTANTDVILYARIGSAAGTIVAQKTITVLDSTPTYSFATPVAFNEGPTGGSLQFNYSSAANKTITFSVVSPSGDVADGSSDVTLTTTTLTVGNTNASSNTTISYSAQNDQVTEGTEYFRIKAMEGTTQIAISDNITINDTSLYPAAGTAIGSAYCVAYGVSPYTLRQVRANGSGGTYNDDTTNSPTCGYVAATYSLSASPTSVNEGSSVTFTLTTNQTGSFAYTISGITSADLSSGSLTGTISNGAAGAVTITLSSDQATEGTETLTFALNNGQANTSVTISDTSQKVVAISRSGGATGTVGTSLSATFTASVNGSQTPAQWSYTGTIPAGTSLSQSVLSFGSYYQIYSLSGTPTTAGTYSYTINATTSGGDSISQSFSTTISNPSPSYSFSNVPSGTVSNGGSTTIYFNSSYASGNYISLSSDSNLVTLSPSSWTVSGNSEAKAVTLTWPTRSPGVSALTVTVSSNKGQSFSFTLPAVTAVVPLVTSVTYSPDQLTYQPGETLTAIINMSGQIISGTYVRVAIWINGTESAPGGWNTITAGVKFGPLGAASITAEFPIGTSAGYHSVTNPGGITATVQIKARTVLDGNSTTDPRQTAYISGPVRNLVTGTAN